MFNLNLSISLGSVDLDNLRTDEDYQREAQRLVPDALKLIGEKSAEFTWNSLQKGLRGIPGIKGNSSSIDKSRFIREGGHKNCRNATFQERRTVENQIIEQLRERKRNAG